MKTLEVSLADLKKAARWDLDYHTPAIEITKFPESIRKTVGSCADVRKTKRDPTRRPNDTFQYIDISSIDVATGVIARPQELTGVEAPSRARKVVHAYDVIISTCRPTRGAIAVVPESLHGQICSTGFSVISTRFGVNPFYLHYALRLESTSEQFRKWSTGSSYPAILDDDVRKTLIPLPRPDLQDQIAFRILTAAAAREAVLVQANMDWQNAVSAVQLALTDGVAVESATGAVRSGAAWSSETIQNRLRELGPVEEVAVGDEDEAVEQSLFDDSDDEDSDPEIAVLS